MINFYQYAIKYNYKKLFNTDKIEMYLNYGFYKIFNRSLEQEKVITGKDDFLFLGNSYSKILHKTQGLYKYEKSDINNWTNNLKDIQTWYEDRGIKFVIVIAPNKHTVYKEKLPDWMKYDGKTITDEIIEFSTKKGINILNLKKIFKEHKNTQLYYTSDTHWNNKGSAIGYKETIKYINNIYNINIKMPKFKLLEQKRKAGDLAEFLKIISILPQNYETNYNFIFKKENNICHGNIGKKQTIEICTNKKNLVMNIGRQSQYMINKSSLNKDKLLLLCDSFGTNHSKLYNETFNTIWKFHYGHIYGSKLSNFISKNKPNIVIYQLVERSLYNNRIIKKIPNIFMIKYNNNGNKIFDINNIQYKYYKNNGFTIKDKKLTTIHNDPIIILNRLKTRSKSVKINYNLNSTVNTKLKLFYKRNRNSSYNEKDSYIVVINKGNNKISLSLPAKYINNNLRIDLVDKIGKYKIKDLSIYELF